MQLAHDLRFRRIGHGGVGMLPITDAAQAHELFTLHADPVAGKIPAIAAQIGDGDLIFRVAALAIALLDFPFDRQTVAVPAGDIGRVEPGHLPRTHHKVLQDLVQRGADMDVAIGIGRAVMQHE